MRPRASLSHSLFLAKLRASSRHHGRHRLCARPSRGHHGCRPSGSTRRRPRDGWQVARGLRCRLRGAPQALGGEPLQVTDCSLVLSAICCDDPDRGPTRRRGLSFDESSRRRGAAGASRDAPICPGHGRVGRLFADSSPLRPAPTVRRDDQIPNSKDGAVRDRWHHQFQRHSPSPVDLPRRDHECCRCRHCRLGPRCKVCPTADGDWLDRHRRRHDALRQRTISHDRNSWRVRRPDFRGGQGPALVHHPRSLQLAARRRQSDS